MIDNRVVRLGIEVDGAVKFYEDLYISAKGVKFTSPNQSQCTIKILNLNRETREYLMREANPFNANGKRKSIILEVGREISGTSTLYTGDIFRVYPTEKPDLGLEIKCITGHFNKGSIVSRSGKEVELLSNIASSVAMDNGLSLSFEIADKSIANYAFTGSPNAQIVRLEELADADVYVDNGTLYMKTNGIPKVGATVRVLNKDSGMIGVPKGTENGMSATMLFDSVTQIGSQIDLESEINPVLDGSYSIYKLSFDITSREDAFYLHAEANRIS